MVGLPAVSGGCAPSFTSPTLKDWVRSQASSEWPIELKNSVASWPHASIRYLGAAGMTVHPLADVVDAAAEDDPEIAGLVVAEDLVPVVLGETGRLGHGHVASRRRVSIYYVSVAASRPFLRAIPCPLHCAAPHRSFDSPRIVGVATPIPALSFAANFAIVTLTPV